jgi:lipopolysaccharide biosynthesis protein
MGTISELPVYLKTKIKNFSLVAKHVLPLKVIEYRTQQDSDCVLSVAIHFHIYYPEYFEQIEQGKLNFPDATIFISVPNEEMLRFAKAKFPDVQIKNIRVVPNRGRNFAPLLLTFGRDLLAFDLVIHLHSKAAYGSLRREKWSQSLWENLYLNTERVELVRRVFESDPQIGLYYPLDFRWMPSVFGWDGSEEIAKKVFGSYSVEIEAAHSLDYPIGGMFWTRRENLELIMRFIQDLELFPPEKENQYAIQNGLTLEHAIERFISVSNSKNGFMPLIFLARGKKFTRGFIDRVR